MLAAGFLTGAAAAGVGALDLAARPDPTYPDYLAWEVCADYVPRWLLPYMRNCVADANAAMAATTEPSRDAGVAARYMMCGFP